MGPALPACSPRLCLRPGRQVGRGGRPCLCHSHLPHWAGVSAWDLDPTPRSQAREYFGGAPWPLAGEEGETWRQTAPLPHCQGPASAPSSSPPSTLERQEAVWGAPGQPFLRSLAMAVNPKLRPRPLPWATLSLAASALLGAKGLQWAGGRAPPAWTEPPPCPDSQTPLMLGLCPPLTAARAQQWTHTHPSGRAGQGDPPEQSSARETTSPAGPLPDPVPKAMG